MRKNFAFLHFLAAAIALSTTFTAQAQNWVNGGNSLAANGSIGTNTDYSFIFKTNNTERGRITNGGRWGIGSTGTSSLFTVNSASGSSSFRAQVNGSTKLIVNSNGGVSIGSSSSGPGNGLYVSGNVGIGTTAPSQKLHVAGVGLFTNGVVVKDGGISSTNTATYGNGVYGSGYYGVNGSGSNVGVYGTSTSSTGYGLYGNAYIGVYASSSADAGDAIRTYAYGSSGYGVNAYSSMSFGIYASTGNSASYAAYFAGSVHTTGTYTGSDQKLKKNITDFDSALDLVNKLQPKSYEYRQDGNYKYMNLPQGKHFGLIAQDIEQVLPNLVKETEFDTRVVQAVTQKPGAAQSELTATQPSEKISYKAVNYTEFIPIMIKAMQELSKKTDEIDQLRNEVTSLKDMVNQLTKSAGAANAILTGSALWQNNPNPVKGTTSIQYSIAQGANNAQLVVTDNLGRTIKSIQLNGSSGTIHIDTSTLSSGVYHYSLLINNKIVQTKKMTVD